jgi:predicted nucleic acid-binding protein
MVLVDTSIWITHFRDGLPALKRLLLDGDVLCHPFVIGELACGHLKNRSSILSLLSSLPLAQEVEHGEILHFIGRYHLQGQGVGLVDIHLLASAALTHVPLWTMDKKLARQAIKAHLNYNPSS